MGRLDNLVVLITGAGSGLGRETAKVFALEGAKVGICGRRNHSIQGTVADIQARGPSHVMALSADVSNEKDVQLFVGRALEEFGRIDVLINNAAVYESYSIAETPLASWRYQLENNVTNAFLMTREILPIMRSRKFGRIINITSSLAKTGAAGFGAYSASKAALDILTATIDEEESKYGIIAHTFNPGIMKSELQATGVHPAQIAPYLVDLCLEDNKYAGKHVDIEQLRASRV